jgi:hypothetical protein
MSVVWDMTPYSLVDRCQRYGGIYYLYLQCRKLHYSSLNVELAVFPEKSALIYQYAPRLVPEDCNLEGIYYF